MRPRSVSTWKFIERRVLTMAKRAALASNHPVMAISAASNTLGRKAATAVMKVCSASSAMSIGCMRFSLLSRRTKSACRLGSGKARQDAV